MQLCVCVSDKYFNNGPSCQNNFDLSSTYIMGQFHVWGAWLVSDVCVCDFVRLRSRPSWSDAGKGCFRGWAITGRPGNTHTHLPKMFAHSLPIQQVGDTKHQNLFSIYIYIYIYLHPPHLTEPCACAEHENDFLCVLVAARHLQTNWKRTRLSLHPWKSLASGLANYWWAIYFVSLHLLVISVLCIFNHWVY